MNKKLEWITLLIACAALVLSVFNLASRPASSGPVSGAAGSSEISDAPESSEALKSSETAGASGTSESSGNSKSSETLASPDSSEQAGEDIQYVMYLGTNDKDTFDPVYDHEQAKEKLDEVLTRHFEGFTIQEATGGWTNEDGTVSHEYTLVIYLSDTTIDKVHEAAADLIQEFNQSSVLIQANKTTTEFYSGE